MANNMRALRTATKKTSKARGLLSIFISITLVLTVLPAASFGAGTNSAYAATYDSAYDNKTFDTAASINLNTDITVVSSGDSIPENRYFKFTLTNTSKISFFKISDLGIFATNYYLFDSANEQLGTSLYNSKDYYLNSGTYILKVQVFNHPRTSGEFKFIISQSAVAESFPESYPGQNNTFETANRIKPNTQYTSVMTFNDSNTTDCYIFELPYDAEVKVTSKQLEALPSMTGKFYKSNGDEIIDGDHIIYIGNDKSVVLSKGKYYFEVDCTYTINNVGGRYQFKLSIKPKAVDVKKVSGKRGAIKIKWAKINGVTGYKIYRAVYSSYSGRNNYKFLKTIKGAGKINYVDKKAKKKNKYYGYKVVAYKGKVQGAIGKSKFKLVR